VPRRAPRRKSVLPRAILRWHGGRGRPAPRSIRPAPTRSRTTPRRKGSPDSPGTAPVRTTGSTRPLVEHRPARGSARRRWYRGRSPARAPRHRLAHVVDAYWPPRTLDDALELTHVLGSGDHLIDSLSRLDEFDAIAAVDAEALAYLLRDRD